MLLFCLFFPGDCLLVSASTGTRSPPSLINNQEWKTIMTTRPNDGEPTAPSTRPRPREKLTRRQKFGIGFVAVVLLGIIIGSRASGGNSSGGGSGTGLKQPADLGVVATTTNPASVTTVSSSGLTVGQSASFSATNPNNAPLTNAGYSAGNTATVQVVLDEVLKSPQLLSQPQSGTYFVGVEWTITNTSDTVITDDSNDVWHSLIDASESTIVIGTDGKSYQPNPLEEITNCPTFAGGDNYILSQEQSATGCVAVGLPTGVGVASVEYSPSAAGTSAQWTA